MAKKGGDKKRVIKRWFELPNPIDRFTGWLVAWTALLTAATIINAIILGITDHTLKETLEANNRAWIAIKTVTLENAPGLGLPVLGHMIYKNTGRSPALNMNYVMLLQRVDLNSEGRPKYGRATSEQVCERVLPGGNLAIFPGDDLAAAFPSGREAVADEELLEGRTLLYWMGCFRYQTYQRTRKTFFCYRLHHNGPSWHWQQCEIQAS
jgi:hypothetical protein